MENKIDKPFILSPSIGSMKYSHIIGREKEITNLLRLLKGQSVSVEEIRRMGKTLLVQKLAYWCNNEELMPKEFENDNFKAHYFIFQGIPNLGKLIDFLIRELRKMQAWYKVDLNKTTKFITDIINAPTVSINDFDFTMNLPKYEKHWKEVLFNILDDIANGLEKKNTKLILIFDELPIMLWDWYKNGEYKEAINLLDILRERRQHLEKKGLRFIFRGSIGINVVLNTFRNKFGYTGEATNEMEQFNVNAFDKEEASFLCECYALSGFEFEENNKKELWKKIFELTNGIPYYIAKLFNIIQTEHNKNITEENIISAYEAILDKTKNHNAFEQLVERINIYYSEPRKQANEMKNILNFLSKYRKLKKEEDILEGLEQDSDDIKKHLYTLLSDHYLIREIKDGQRYYKFKYEIFRQWWKINIA